jgi:NitT/TauT family transport system permease protein
VRRFAALAAPVLLVALLLAGWEAACRALAVPPYFLPAPSGVARALVAQGPSLIAAGWKTLARALLALVVAGAIATPLALATALSRTVERAVAPLAVALQVTPVIAIAPLVNIWAGIDHPERAIVALAAVVAFYPLFSAWLTGVKSADPDLERLFDLYGADRLQRLARLRLPSAIPFVLEGLKVAAGLAVIGAVVAEFASGSGGAQGLAWRILDAGNRLRTAEMIAALVVLALMGAGLNALFSLLQRLALTRWRGR